MIELKWTGPIGIDAKEYIKFLNVDESDIDKPGIYIWTIKKGGKYYTTYVGKTSRSFKVRLGEEISYMFKGGCCLYDFSRFKDGLVDDLQECEIYNPEQKGNFKKDYFDSNALKNTEDYLLFIATFNEDCNELLSIETKISNGIRVNEPASTNILGKISGTEDQNLKIKNIIPDNVEIMGLS